jgi:hypothetical protein
MSSDQQPSRVDANTKYYQGAAKETIGKAIGNEQMQAEGLAKKLEGIYFFLSRNQSLLSEFFRIFKYSFIIFYLKVKVNTKQHKQKDKQKDIKTTSLEP